MDNKWIFISFIAFIFAIYEAIKNGVKDGIKETKKEELEELRDASESEDGY